VRDHVETLAPIYDCEKNRKTFRANSESRRRFKPRRLSAFGDTFGTNQFDDISDVGTSQFSLSATYIRII